MVAEKGTSQELEASLRRDNNVSALIGQTLTEVNRDFCLQKNRHQTECREQLCLGEARDSTMRAHRVVYDRLT